LGKGREHMAQHLTATLVTLTELTRKIEGCNHKLYVDNFFSAPHLSGDLTKKQIYCCGEVRWNRWGREQDIGPKKIKAKQVVYSHKYQR
jgi:hypothetical protein